MSLLYSVKEGVSGIGRTKLPATVTMLTGFLSLVLLGLFGTVSMSFYQLIQEVRSRVELEVFFDDNLSDDRVAALSTQMQSIAGIGQSRYVSRNEAASRFARDFGEDVVAVLGTNPLPRSVRLSIRQGFIDPGHIANIEAAIRALDEGLDVRYNQAYLSGIERNAHLFTLITAGIGGVIALATVVMNAYTVRLAMYARRDRIKTMRLVGATRRFISAPFLIEGALQGAVSGGFASLCVYLVFEQALVRYEPIIYQILRPSALLIYPGLALLGVLLGLFGSMFSVARFIRAS